MPEFKPFSAKQMQVISGDLPRLTILDGSVRSGKTMSANIRFFIKMIRELPPGDLLVSGKTKHTIKRNVLNDVFEIWGKKNYSYNSADGVIHAFGRRIWVVGANDEKSENKIRGMSIAGYYGDEESLKPKSFFQMVQTRLDKKGAKALITTNPDNPYHWLKKEFIDNQNLYTKGILKRIHFTMDDNWALDPEVKETLENSFSGVFYDRMIRGLWVVAEGLIYDMFTERKHVGELDLKENKPQFYVVSCDYGTRNPTAFLMAAIRFDEDTGKPYYYILKEYYYDSQADENEHGQKKKQKTDGQYYVDLDRFAQGTPVNTIILDPSAASFEAEINSHGRYHVQHADNDVLPGIMAVANAFREKRIVIHPHCTNLIRELRTYSWDEKKAEKGIDYPLTVNDHAADALRYLVYKYEGGNRPGIRSMDDWEEDDY